MRISHAGGPLPPFLYTWLGLFFQNQPRYLRWDEILLR